MKTSTMHSPLKAMAVWTATAVVALAAGVMQSANAAPGEHGGAGMGAMGGHAMHHHGMAGLGGGAHAARLLDAVGASADQKAQIKQIMDTARNDLAPAHQQLRTLRQQGVTLFTQTNVDANAVEALRLQMHALHGQVGQRMLTAMIDASRVLTPEQRAKVADMMANRRAMAERHRAEAAALGAKPAPGR